MLKGQKMPAAGRAKLSASLRGRTVPAEVRAKMSANSAKVWLGKRLPPHVVVGMSERRRGSIPWNKGKSGEYAMPQAAIEAMRQRMLGARVGAKNPMWKGGVSPIRTRLWQSARYRAWREAIFERDGYACRMCGASGCRVEADHFPVPFVAHLERIKATVGVDGLYDAAMADSALWNAEGRTLCVPCHNSTKRGRATYLRSQEEEMRLAR